METELTFLGVQNSINYMTMFSSKLLNFIIDCIIHMLLDKKIWPNCATHTKFLLLFTVVQAIVFVMPTNHSGVHIFNFVFVLIQEAQAH